MLDKPWKSIVLIALNELQVPNDDDQENTTANQSVRNRRGSRRRGGRSSGGPLEWLPKANEAIIEDGTSLAFRLATLLVRKTLFSEDWDDGWNETVDSLREEAMEKGVHPFWQKVAEATPILAQFAAFPKLEVSEEIEDKFDLSFGWVDPADAKSLAIALGSLETNTSNASLKSSLQKARAQLNGKRGLRDYKNLQSLEGDASLISSLIEIHLGIDSTDSLKILSKHDKKLSKALNQLVTLRSGKLVDWDKLRSLKDSNQLSISIRKEAWKLAPETAKALPSKEITIGLESVTQASNKEKLTWWLISALVRENNNEEANKLLQSISVDSEMDVTELLPIVGKIGEGASAWLLKQIPRLSIESLSQIVDDENQSVSLRMEAAKELSNSESEIDLESSIDLFTRGLDLHRLANLLLDNPEYSSEYPFETLLVAHLLPAKAKEHNFAKLRNARKMALSTFENSKPPSAFSEVSCGLILMLDGAPQSGEKWVIDTLDKKGMLAFNQCRQALREGGDGLTNTKILDDLETAIKEAELTEVELRLFTAVMDTLRLNRASLLLQSGQQTGVEDLLNSLLNGEETAMPMIEAVKHLVLEYDIGLPNLVSWYQANDPQSPWHTISRAAVHSSKSSELNAARDYRKAGDHSDFDYEHKIMLYRKALIHLAHSRQWSEAVELLDSQQALKTAVTKRFQLYLRVSNSAANSKRADQATRMVKDFAKTTKMVDQENQDGEIVRVKRIKYSEEELDLLRNYPHSHSRPLPLEPFSGRVKAALNSLQRERKSSNKNTFEHKYSIAMQYDKVNREEIYEIASKAAAQNPLEGLMLLERAQNSSKLELSDKKRLAVAEQGLFATHKHNLAVKQRAYLRTLNLKPLVIVDTNILIDELHHRVSEQIGISFEASLDVGGQGQFHRLLKRRSLEGKVYLWLPKVIRSEFESLSVDVDRMQMRFADAHIPSSVLGKSLNKDNLEKLAKQIISDYSTWSPLDLHIEDEIHDEELRRKLDEFLLRHYEVYDEITAMKRQHSEPLRTEIEGKDVYPESADKSIMCLASILADKPLPGIGSILVATRDSDFALVARAVEERFGFGVVANSRTFNSWSN